MNSVFPALVPWVSVDHVHNFCHSCDMAKSRKGKRTRVDISSRDDLLQGEPEHRWNLGFYGKSGNCGCHVSPSCFYYHHEPKTPCLDSRILTLTSSHTQFS